MHRTSSRLLAGILLTVAGALVASSGCTGSAFPTSSRCQTNADCAGGDAPKPGEKKHGVCFDYRCVECHYDDDCPDDSACNKLNECASLRSTKPDDSATPGGAGSSSAISPPTHAF